MKKLLAAIILLTVCSIHAQTDDKETLKHLNQNVVSSYKNQKLDNALKFALQAVDLSIKIYGTENPETAVAYTNAGIIYRDKGKFDKSIENLQKAVEIYQKIPALKGKELVTAYEALAFSQLQDGKKKESETNYLKALEAAESKFGKEGRESFSPTLNLASFYARSGEFETADEFYLKSYVVAIKNFGKEAQEFEQIEDSRTCLIDRLRVDREKGKAFQEAKNKLFGFTDNKNLGVLNGKALSLPKPGYPAEARQQRISGSVSVKVKIDESGTVTEVKAICGPAELRKASENSAKGAKFSPTSLNGQPVKVSGIITYNFIP